jgi:hypothetical protein
VKCRVLLFVLALAVLGAAQPADAMTRKQLRNRSAEICANADRAMQPADDRANRAAARGERNKFVRYARKGIRIGAPYIERLADLNAPPRGRDHYLNFIDHTQRFVGWLKAMVNAIDNRRSAELVERRSRKAARQRKFAKRAARAYPLRRACVRMLVAN